MRGTLQGFQFIGLPNECVVGTDFLRLQIRRAHLGESVEVLDERLLVALFVSQIGQILQNVVHVEVLSHHLSHSDYVTGKEGGRMWMIGEW